MKRKLLLFIGAALAVPLLWAASAQAFNGHAGERVEVAKGQVLDSAFFGAGKTIVIAGTVKGDVFCAGQTVEITGVVEGDVLCAAQDILISGTVDGDVRVLGQNVRLQGVIQTSASLAGQVLTVEQDAVIARDLSLAGQNMRVQGQVGRDLAAAGESATLEGKVSREARLFTATTTVKSSARLGGDFIYTSKNEAVIESGAQITGKTDHQMPPQKQKAEPSVWRRVMGPLYGIVTMLLAGSVLLLLAPRWFNKAAMTMRQRPLPVFGIGLAGLLVPPFVAAGLCLTFVGLPLGILGLIAWIVICASSLVFSAYSIGQLIVKRLAFVEKWPQFASLVVGVLLFGLLFLIPVINLLMVLGALFWGIGGILWAIGQAVSAQRKPAVGSKKA